MHDKEGVMGGACGTYGLGERNHVEDLSLHGNLILK